MRYPRSRSAGYTATLNSTRHPQTLATKLQGYENLLGNFFEVPKSQGYGYKATLIWKLVMEFFLRYQCPGYTATAKSTRPFFWSATKLQEYENLSRNFLRYLCPRSTATNLHGYENLFQVFFEVPKSWLHGYSQNNMSLFLLGYKATGIWKLVPIFFRGTQVTSPRLQSYTDLKTYI
jgi:hypothetical protein